MFFQPILFLEYKKKKTNVKKQIISPMDSLASSIPGKVIPKDWDVSSAEIQSLNDGGKSDRAATK